MQTKQITVFDFNELSDNAKARVQQWILSDGYAWADEGIDSVKAFAAQFGVKVKDYELGTCAPSFIRTDVENAHFRGFTLAKAKELPEFPTGYCLDCTLREEFIRSFEKTGNAKCAFENAIDAAVRDIVADFEYQESEEAIAETCEANGYQFTENGVIA